MNDNLVRISTFRCRFDNHPRLEAWPWPKLIERLTTHERRPYKDGPLLAPAIFKKGARRCREDVECVTLAAGEFDHAPYEVVQEAVEPYECVEYSTYSSTPEQLRFRAFIRLARPVSAGEWPTFKRSLDQHIFKGLSDPSTKDLGRMYYFPSCPPDALCFAVYHPGKPLDPDELPVLSMPVHHGKPTNTAEFAPADIGLILGACGWIRHCRDGAAHLSEPEWYGALSILARCKDGENLAHQWSEPYPNYTPQETVDKLQHAIESAGPRTCASIRYDLGGAKYCAECEHQGRLTSPILLGRHGSIVTHDDGLRVRHIAGTRAGIRTIPAQEVAVCLR